jgi:hypothetical protein
MIKMKKKNITRKMRDPLFSIDEMKCSWKNEGHGSFSCNYCGVLYDYDQKQITENHNLDLHEKMQNKLRAALLDISTKTRHKFIKLAVKKLKRKIKKEMSKYEIKKQIKGTSFVFPFLILKDEAGGRILFLKEEDWEFAKTQIRKLNLK